MTSNNGEQYYQKNDTTNILILSNHIGIYNTINHTRNL